MFVISRRTRLLPFWACFSFTLNSKIAAIQNDLWQRDVVSVFSLIWFHSGLNSTDGLFRSAITPIVVTAPFSGIGVTPASNSITSIALKLHVVDCGVVLPRWSEQKSYGIGKSRKENNKLKIKVKIKIEITNKDWKKNTKIKSEAKAKAKAKSKAKASKIKIKIKIKN